MIYSNKYQSKIFSRVFRENIGRIQNFEGYMTRNKGIHNFIIASYFRIVLIETFYTELLTFFCDKNIQYCVPFHFLIFQLF